MKLQVPIFLAAALTAAGCGDYSISKMSIGEGSDMVVGNGKVITRSYHLAEFSKIQAGTAVSIVYTTGSRASVLVEAEENVFPALTVDSRHDVLHVSLHGSVSTSKPIRVTIVNPRLSRVDLRGAVQAEFSGLSETSFEAVLEGATQARISGRIQKLSSDLGGSSSLTLSTPVAVQVHGLLDGNSSLKIDGTVSGLELHEAGSSTVEISKISARTVAAIVDSASAVTAAGIADSVIIHASGASTVTLRELKIGSADIGAEGASQVRLGQTSRLKARADGASQITYGGAPSIESRSATGASSISRG